MLRNKVSGHAGKLCFPSTLGFINRQYIKMKFNQRALREGILELDYKSKGGATQRYHSITGTYPPKTVLFEDDLQEEHDTHLDQTPIDIFLDRLKAEIKPQGYELDVLSKHQIRIKKSKGNLEGKF